MSILISAYELYLSNSFLKNSSTVIGVILTSLAFLVMMHPVFVTHIPYNQPLCFASLCLGVVPWVHGLPASNCMATVDPVDIIIGSLRVSLYSINSF